MIKKWKKMMIFIVVLTLIISNQGIITLASESNTISSNGLEEQGYSLAEESDVVLLKGKIYSMGYECEISPYILTDKITISATGSDNSYRSVSTTTGEYELELKADVSYSLRFSGYISGRMAQMNVVVGDFSPGSKPNFNLCIRTKNVLGLEQIHKYEYPEDSLIIRDLGYGIFHNEIISFKEQKVSIEVKEEKQLEVVTNSGLKYENSLIYTSSNPEIATVDENTGKVTGISVGTTSITCVSRDNEVAALCEVEVTRGGFDPSIDGYCFPNSRGGFRYDDCDKENPNEMMEVNKNGEKVKVHTISKERYLEVFGDFTGNLYRFLRAPWDGNCFGMSITSLLFYYGYLPNLLSTSSLDIFLVQKNQS